MPTKIRPGAVVRRTFDIYREEAGLLLPAALVLYAVEFVVALALGSVTGLVLAILYLVLALLYQGLVVELVSDVQHGHHRHTIGTLVEAVTPILLPLLAVSILFGIAVAIGFVLLIVPGLILLTLWAVVVPVVVLERLGVFASFGRSRELVRGNGWEVFGVLVLFFLVTVAVSLVAALVAAPLGHVGRALIQWAVNIFLAPLAALGASVLYFALLESRGATRSPDLAAPPMYG